MHPDSLLSALAIALLLGISITSAAPDTNWHELLRVGLPLCMAVVVAVLYCVRRQRPRRSAHRQAPAPRNLLLVWVNVRWGGLEKRNSGH